MNPASLLLDENYIRELFRQEVLPQYPGFQSIGKIRIRPYKKMMWSTTYHMVIKYVTHFIAEDGASVRLPIVATAHSSEAREKVFSTLSYLWNHNLSDNEINIPRPLFYQAELRATFYRAIEGENLLYFIKSKDWPELEDGMLKTARLFAKIHSLPIEGDYKFNEENSRVATVLPGDKFVLAELARRFEGRYLQPVSEIYKYIIDCENVFLDNTAKRWLVHGDAHPENVIKLTLDRIGIIDFTDFCLADFTRDLGAFIQQMEYRMRERVDDPSLIDKMKHLFLDEYFRVSSEPRDAAIEERINIYYNFASLRTAIYWLLKHDCDPARADSLLDKIQNNLDKLKD